MSPKTKQTLFVAIAVVAAAALMLFIQNRMRPSSPQLPGGGDSTERTNPTTYQRATPANKKTKDKPMTELTQATFGGGCFWCTEAVFRELDGVQSVVSGYSGGETVNPTYEEICTGQTGHAEVIHIDYDPTRVSFAALLEVFFKTHDPTTLNRQGADTGTQYRSVVFYHDQEQKKLTEQVIAELEKVSAFDSPIVTEISPFDVFYPAEDYHQNYYAQNKYTNGYCTFTIGPKLEKFRKVFGDKLKKNVEATE